MMQMIRAHFYSSVQFTIVSVANRCVTHFLYDFSFNNWEILESLYMYKGNSKRNSVSPHLSLL